MTQITLLAAQVAVPSTPTRAARDAHVARMAETLDAALCQRPADLVVLPELSTISYDRATFDTLDTLADPIERSTCVETLAQVARTHGTQIVFGLPRRDGDRFFISLAVLSAEGDLSAVYDKLHICHYGASMEKDYFTAGDHLTLIEVKGVTIGLIICYDIRFPELSRALCDHGASLILHCGAYARDESFATWHDFVITRAMENQLFLLSLNRAGEDFGGSMFCGPWVDADHPKQALGRSEELAYFTVETAELDRVRDGYSFLKDRLGQYSDL